MICRICGKHIKNPSENSKIHKACGRCCVRFPEQAMLYKMKRY